jgi:hypothetical protein
MAWIVRWCALEERFASAWEALDRWEELDALGREPKLFEVLADGRRTAIPGRSRPG